MLLTAFQMYTQTTYNYLFLNFYEKPGLTVCDRLYLCTDGIVLTDRW